MQLESESGFQSKPGIGIGIGIGIRLPEYTWNWNQAFRVSLESESESRHCQNHHPSLFCLEVVNKILCANGMGSPAISPRDITMITGDHCFACNWASRNSYRTLIHGGLSGCNNMFQFYKNMQSSVLSTVPDQHLSLVGQLQLQLLGNTLLVFQKVLFSQHSLANTVFYSSCNFQNHLPSRLQHICNVQKYSWWIEKPKYISMLYSICFICIPPRRTNKLPRHQISL